MDIKVKALGLHWRDGRLLAAEVRDEHGRAKVTCLMIFGPSATRY
jgi:hypothetical protein